MSSDDKPRSPLQKLKTGVFSRGMAIAKLSAAAGAKALASATRDAIAGRETNAMDRVRDVISSQAKMLALELGELKGSLMKAGQMLSVYGEHLLPPEVNQVLKTLQSQSPPVAWEVMKRVLERELPPERMAELEISETPLASASLGQVHLATRKSDGARIALKIQYEGVERAIESDVKALRRLLSLSKILPSGPSFDSVFTEVKEMLTREVDYKLELKTMEAFRGLLAGDARYVIPETYAEYSGARVLATSFEAGVSPDSPQVAALTLERRNRLAENFLDLYFNELFVWRTMQTDPHFGNYRIRLGAGGDQSDQIVLLDFGSVRDFESSFVEEYRELCRASLDGNAKRVQDSALRLGFVLDESSQTVMRHFTEFCFMMMEPFSGGPYRWGKGDLPARVIDKAKELASANKIKPPPREIVFLDRKLGGVFTFLAVMKADFNARPWLERHLLAGARIR